MKALTIASLLDKRDRSQVDFLYPNAAAELRRLAEVNTELLEALQTAVGIMKIQRDIVERGQHSSAWDHPISMCEKSIAKAKEQQ